MPGVSVYDPQSFPIWVNLALFAAAAAFVWSTGTRLARYAERISDRTGLGQAFVGVVFLAIATSLPEVATTVTASAIGNAPLALNNLMGGIVLQTAVLVIADRVSGGKALTHFIVRSVLLLEGLLLVILLAVTLVGINVGDVHGTFGIGLWPVLIFLTYLFTLWVVQQYRRDERWQPIDIDSEEVQEASAISAEQYETWSNRKLYLAFVGGSIVILVAGTVIGRTGDALASQTGLGGSFVGVTVVALATSLPEISTTVTAARIGAYSMAISNIFGSNMLMPALIFPADLTYRAGPVLNESGVSITLAAGAGIVVTAIYLVGLVEHRDRTIAGVGLDSAAVFVIYLCTLVAQYLLR